MAENFLKMALDFSGPYVNLAIANDANNEIVLTASKLMQRREASAITSFIAQTMQENNLSLDDVKKFTVGSGPGSFTGMRIAAAWVSGFTFDKKVSCRTIPSAFAIAESAKILDNETACIIFDGRNKEVIVFGVAKKDGVIYANGVEAILNSEQAVEFFSKNLFDKYLAMQYDERAVKLILGDDFSSKLEIIPEVDAVNLLSESLGEFDNDLTKLYYIRPSVANSNE